MFSNWIYSILVAKFINDNYNDNYYYDNDYYDNDYDDIDSDMDTVYYDSEEEEDIIVKCQACDYCDYKSQMWDGYVCSRSCDRKLEMGRY